MFVRHLDLLLSVWREALSGGGLILAGVAVGWHVGARTGWRPVRIVSWWLRHVVGAVLGSTTWLRRTAIIATNNSLVCAAVVALGSFGPVVWPAVGAVGVGLGVAIRLITAMPMRAGRPEGARARGRRGLIALGLLLNLLEIPAIIFSTGLGLSQGAMSSGLSGGEAWATFGLVVFPVLLISAAGEALWMTEGPKLPILYSDA